MICSYTELKNLIYSSGIGSKIDIGVCEDVSQASANLERYNISASREVLKCFQSPFHKKTNIRISKRSLSFGVSQVLYEGISAIDNFRTGFYDEITFEKLDSPIILLGLALINKVMNFQIICSSNIVSYVDNNKFYWNDSFNQKDISISIKKIKYSPPFYNKTYDQIIIDDITWDELNHLSRKTLVPESKESRDMGAGAGNNDND